MSIEMAGRLKKLPPYIFAEIDKKKKALMAAGKDVINLGVGDPDQPTPKFIIDAAAEAMKDPATHQYAFDNGDPAFRQAIADFMQKRYGVKLDPATEVYPTLGSKEAIAHLPVAFVDPGDVVLYPEPGYPPYRTGSMFLGGVPVAMELKRENNFFPDFAKIPASLARHVKILWLNYPNSPTGKLATKAFYTEAIAWAKKYNVLIAQDMAYGEMAFEGRALSILEFPEARDIAIEFHSCSKTFNMTGWRVGWACGAPQLIKGLGIIKSNVDSGIFTALQRAATVALQKYDSWAPQMVSLYKKRRDVFYRELNAIGWNCTPPEATFHCWLPTPKGVTSMDCATKLLEEAAIVTVPGSGFGPAGEGYIRAVLTVNEERLALAAQRIKAIKF